MMSEMLRVVTLFLAVLLSAQGALAQTIFRTDFEDVADWSVNRPFPSGVSFPNSWTLKPGGPSPQPPKKIDGSWLYLSSWTRIAPSILPSPSPTPMATIGAGQGKGGSRGMIYNVEVSGQLGIWSGGSPLVMYLGNVGYPDLYVSMWVKYDPLFTWLPATPTSGSQQKLVYISRLNEILSSSSDADNHSNGPLHPSWLPHWFNYISASPFYAYYANRSQQSNGALISYDQTMDMYSNNRSYYPQGGPFKWPESIPHVTGVQSDGQWHHYQYHVKMNSAPGAVDGVQEVWLDGVLQFSKKDMPFVLAGGSTTVGWNYVEFFDNSNILSHPASESVVYPIALDKLVVGNEYAGPPAMPESISASLINDTDIKVKWRAGNNGAVYPLTGYRIYCTDSSNVTATYDVGNVTEFNITGLIAATQYKFTVTALNSDSFGAESESLRPPKVSAITIDVILPHLTITTMPSVTATKSQRIAGTVSDAGGIASVTVKVGGLTAAVATVDGSDWTYTIPTLTEGGNSITITATDMSGNQTVMTRTILLDTTPPVLAILPVVTPTILTSQTISGTVTDLGGVTSVFVQVGTGEKQPALLDGSSWSYRVAGFQPGSSTRIYVSAQDTAGNVSTQSTATTIAVLLAGDLTGDLVVGVEDALLAMQIASGQRTANAVQLKAADVAPLVGGVPAPNGIVDTGDAIVILAVVAGLRKF